MTHAKDDLPISHANEVAEAIAKDLRQMIKNAEIWGAEQVLAEIKKPRPYNSRGEATITSAMIHAAEQALTKIKNDE